jgi:hypothetical protein
VQSRYFDTARCLDRDRGIAAANCVLDKIPDAQGKPKWLMPGFLIPKVVIVAWLVLLLEKKLGWC